MIGSAAAAVGTAAGIVVSAPVAIIDPQARRHLGDRVEHLGNNIQDTGAAVGDTVTTPFQNPGAPR